MAASCLTHSSSSLLIYSGAKLAASGTIVVAKPTVSCSSTYSSCLPYPCLSMSFSSSPLWQFLHNKVGSGESSVLAVVSQDQWVAEAESEEFQGEEGFEEEDDDPSPEHRISQTRPCELYVCNLPRGLDISDLLDMFKPFGNVLSVEVSKNPQTGVSRGCGFVTMGSISSAKSAIAALDRSDVDGREMRVRYSVEMNSSRNPMMMNSAPKKNLVYESPYKVYVGNLAWSTKPEEVRDIFSQFGTVVSTRVLHDRKAGKYRVYAFLSFTSAAERDASVALDGKDFRGRPMVVRRGWEKQ